mgnify:CR=1 FL=1
MSFTRNGRFAAWSAIASSIPDSPAGPVGYYARRDSGSASSFARHPGWRLRDPRGPPGSSTCPTRASIRMGRCASGWTMHVPTSVSRPTPRSSLGSRRTSTLCASTACQPIRTGSRHSTRELRVIQRTRRRVSRYGSIYQKKAGAPNVAVRRAGSRFGTSIFPARVRRSHQDRGRGAAHVGLWPPADRRACSEASATLRRGLRTGRLSPSTTRATTRTSRSRIRRASRAARAGSRSAIEYRLGWMSAALSNQRGVTGHRRLPVDPAGPSGMDSQDRRTRALHEGHSPADRWRSGETDPSYRKRLYEALLPPGLQGCAHAHGAELRGSRWCSPTAASRK